MPRRIALWELGFRPFFLLGLMAAGGLLAVWLVVYAGGADAPVYFDPVHWHAHEMIYGFASAVIVGFILTASQSWTNIPGVKGPKLMVLAALWVLARLLLVVPGAPRGAVAAVDLAFLPLAAVFLIPYLAPKGQRRNAVFLVLLGLMTCGNALMHFGYERRGAYLGLYVAVFMIVVIGGRVIPLFSEKAVPGYRRPLLPTLDKAALGTTAVFLVTSFVDPFSKAAGITAGVAALVHLGRWSTWLNWRVWRVPILAVLYVGYFWVVVGFVLTALASLALVSPVAATHAFTVGAIGTMIIGMISRVSLGHNGRPIAARRATSFAYVLVSVAAFVRVFGPILAPERYMLTVQVSGTIWIVAFCIVLADYAPILLRPRADGRPG